MKRSTFLLALFGACFLIAVLQNVLMGGQNPGNPSTLAQSFGTGIFYWMLSAIPVAFQRQGVKVWPSALVLAILAGFATIGRL